MPGIPETAEERSVREIINEAKERLTQIDQDIRQHGPAPQPTPPGGGMFMGPNAPNRMMEQEAKEHARKAIFQDALNKSAEAIKGAPVAIQAKAFKLLDAFVYPDTAPPTDRKAEKDLDEAQRSAMHQTGRTERSENKKEKVDIDAAQRSALHQMGFTDKDIRHEKVKDLSESQDYAMRIRGDEKEKNKEVKPDKKREPFKGASLSKSFTASLGYHKLNKPLNKALENKEERATMYMSGNAFLADLSYNYINRDKGTIEPGPVPASKEADKDWDKDK